jgi:hypothetical protein
VQGYQCCKHAARLEVCAIQPRGQLMPLMLQGHRASADESDENTSKHCFTIAFSVVFLRDVLGIAGNDTRVTFASSLPQRAGGDPVPLDWPLGVMLTQAAHLKDGGPEALTASLGVGQDKVRKRARVGQSRRSRDGGLRLAAAHDDDDDILQPLLRALLWGLLWTGLAAAILLAFRCVCNCDSMPCSSPVEAVLHRSMLRLRLATLATAEPLSRLFCHAMLTASGVFACLQASGAQSLESRLLQAALRLAGASYV